MADNLLREVDEALRADRAAAFWQKNRSAIVTLIVAVIVATAAHSAWQKYREVQGGKVLVQFSDGEKLLQQNQPKEAAAKFESIAQNASGEQADLARIWQSRALVMAGDKEGAVAALKAATGGSNLWSDIACLRLAGLDAAAATDCLSAKKQTPMAAERAQWAVANQWASGDQAGAIAKIEAMLEDPNISQDSRMMLSQWLATMKAQEGKKE